MKIFEKIKERSKERKTGVKKERKKSFRRLEKEENEAEILRLHDELKTKTPGTEEYDAIQRELNQLKNSKERKVKDWGPIVGSIIGATASVFGTIALFVFEKDNVIRSKGAFSWIHKPRC